MFLEVLNGAYSAAGLEGRIKGIGLNKIVAGLHSKYKILKIYLRVKVI